MTGNTVDPVTMSKWAYENAYLAEGVGSYHSLIPDGAKHFGLNVTGASINETQKIINALTQGKLVIAIMGKGHFTSSGHFMVLRGVTSEGEILIADPASRKRSEQVWDFSIILNEARKNASAGGPFWIIG
ncbi:C39 family peptidase [Paenibacillus sp. FSL R7-0048]|uniref:C39 family peptidase n=1 Tax=Paenibacillus TaxID=44249 RepID=UPI0021170EBA|nr:C39 family peptidase [Paenibacillus odorifer]